MEEDGHNYFESRTPHFFKIILHETLQKGKLELPKSFLGKHGSVLCSNMVCLKVTSGDVWEVELCEENDGTWFHKGWQEFVEFYRIQFGYFLVFGYQGNSEFQVLIFDQTASEIDYPVKSCNNNKRSDGVNPCLSPVKPEIGISDSKMSVDHNAYQKNANKKTKRRREGSGDDDSENGVLGTSKSCSLDKTREKAAAIFRTRDFKSPHPYFRVLLQSSHVNGRCVLHLPGRFAMKHFGQRDDFYPILSLPCGRFWIVQYRFKMVRGAPVARFQFGWNLFVEDNKLVIGDVCIFELLDSVNVQFKVTIFRAAEDKIFGPFPGSGSIDPDKVHGCAQTNSNLTVKLEPKECSGGQISQEPLQCKGSNAEIQSAATRNRTGNNPSEVVKIESEECTGEQISQEPLHCKGSTAEIQSATTRSHTGKNPSDEVKLPSEEGNGEQISQEPLHFEASSAEIQNADTRNHTAENPSFKLTVTKSNITRTFVSLPKSFLKHLNNKSTPVTFEVDGKYWQLSATYYPRTRTGSFASGWRTFIAENSLKAGDVCEFELIDMENMILKVSIHRDGA